LAALFWSWGADDDIIARLVKKTLFVGVFAYLIIGNWNNLARIVFESFAGLGLKASGTVFSVGGSLRPGKIAQTGLDAGRPLLDSISNLMGWISFFENFIQIACSAVRLGAGDARLLHSGDPALRHLIEFKLTTLAGFVLIPFGLFGKSAFMAERVFGNVISSGIKVLVLAVIIGIGSTLFASSRRFGGQTADHRPRDGVVLAALSLLGLGIFGPGIANGLVSGGPQLGAGAAVGTGLAAGGIGRPARRYGRPRARGGAARFQERRGRAGGASMAGGASTAYSSAPPAVRRGRASGPVSAALQSAGGAAAVSPLQARRLAPADSMKSSAPSGAKVRLRRHRRHLDHGHGRRTGTSLRHPCG
jgi:type IV secretion system protein TrbL